MPFSKTLTTALVSVAACALMPAMAATQFEPEEKSREISIRGYNLTNITDANTVFEMINTAAKRVCKHHGLRETLRERVNEKKCREEAITSAVESVDSPQLKAIMREQLD